MLGVSKNSGTPMDGALWTNGMIWGVKPHIFGWNTYVGVGGGGTSNTIQLHSANGGLNIDSR